MHSMIYFGFLVLLGVTTVLEIDHQLPESLKFLHGRTYQAYAFVADLAGLVFVGGLVWAIARRYVARPYRIRIKTRPEHAVILGVLLAIGLTGFAAEMFRIAEATRRRAAGGRVTSWTSSSGASSAGRSARSSTAGRSTPSTPSTSGRGSPTSWRSSPSS